MKNQTKIREQCSLLSIILVTILFAMASCGKKDEPEPKENDDDIVKFVDEYEPNNERSTAFLIELNTTYNAKIDGETDDDWFKIIPAHGSDTYDKIQITVTNVSADLYIHMELYSIDGASLATFGTKTKGQDLTYTFATPGVEYYVRFSGWDGYVNDHNSSGNYSFTVSNLNANDDFAPNHTIETAANSLEYNTSYNGVIVSMYENDYYKFTNPTPGIWNSYTFTLTNVSDDLYG